mgnify:CR=1 FL=1
MNYQQYLLVIMGSIIAEREGFGLEQKNTSKSEYHPNEVIRWTSKMFIIKWNNSQLHSAPVSGKASDRDQYLAIGGIYHRLNPEESNYEVHQYNLSACKDGY